MFLRGGAARRRFVDPGFEVSKADVEIAEEIAKIRTDYSEDARNKLVVKLARIPLEVASRYAHRFPSREADIVGVAFLALIKAIDKIAADPTLCEHNNFLGFLSVTISGACAKFIEADTMIRVPYDKRCHKVPCAVSSDLVECAIARENQQSPADLDRFLTPVELSIVTKRASGKKFQDIARELNLSRPTINKYAKSAEAKLRQHIKEQL